MTGRIFNIQRFSVHDGPGIRDIVFFKGCPLRCLWCSNPESQGTGLELGFRTERCIGAEGCGYCIEACPGGVLKAGESGLPEAGEGCTRCGRCAAACPAQARRLFGEDVTVEEVAARLQNQAGAWRASGGVTLSGGEPLMQADFAAALLGRLKETGIHTALETCGYAPWEAVEQVAALCDVVYFDVKLADRDRHLRYTGVDNRIILDNLARLRGGFPQLHLVARTPVVPGVNDGEELEAIARLLGGIGGMDGYELLPYHSYGEGKYRQLGRQYGLADTAPPDKEELAAQNERLQRIACVERGMGHDH